MTSSKKEKTDFLTLNYGELSFNGKKFRTKKIKEILEIKPKGILKSENQIVKNDQFMYKGEKYKCFCFIF